MGNTGSCFAGLKLETQCKALSDTEAPIATAAADKLCAQKAAPQDVPSNLSDSDDTTAVSVAGTRPGRNDPNYAHRAPPQLQSEENSSQDDDQEAFTQMFSMPYAEPGPDGLPSVGSAGHETGECKRCAFFPKARCQNGYACNFCHFDHEKARRHPRKKRGAGSAPPTPSDYGCMSDALAAAAGVTGAVGLMQHSPNQMLLSPSHQHGDYGASVSPHGPPAAPPQVALLAPAQMPPAPGLEPQLLQEQVDAIAAAAASTGEADTNMLAAHPALTSLPMSWSTPSGVPSVGVACDRVTINDILGTVPQGAPVSSVSEDQHDLWQQQAHASNVCDDQHQLWEQQQQYWGTPEEWAYYNEYHYQDHMTPEMMGYPSAAVASECPAEQMAYHGEHPVETATQQPRLPSLEPSICAPALAGLGKDSPRSVLLTLCGAWGALTEEKILIKDEAAVTSSAAVAATLEAPAPPLSRDVLLGYRAVCAKPPPEAIKSMRATSKRGAKIGPKRGRAS